MRTILTAFLACLFAAGCSVRVTSQNAAARGWIRTTLQAVDSSGRGYVYRYLSEDGTTYERRIRNYVPSLVGTCYLIDPKTSKPVNKR